MSINIDTMRKSVQEWQTINKLPPLKEVQVLRFLDANEKGEITIDDQTAAKLYCMLAFYRLKRNFKDDKVTTILLEEGKRLAGHESTLVEIEELKSFFTFYTLLSEVNLDQWSIRETDFDSAKLKKATELKAELAKLNITPVDKHSTYTKLFNEITAELTELEQTLADTISSLENRRSGVPVTALNNHVRKIIQYKQEFYHHFPDVLKKNASNDPLDQLQHLTGLTEVKKYIHQYYHYLKYQKKRRELGFHMVDEPGLHMIITGNPGTGKTSIARLLAATYHELGLLETDKVIEVNRSHLVGSYVGQSEENTISYVKQSIGGILFIDEAYSLKRVGQTANDYGQAVIDTLVSSMTSKEFANKFAVILAGYPEEMRQFLWSNPGLRSRFPEQNSISLPNFSMNELMEIAENTAMVNDYFFTAEALNQFETIVEKSMVDETFGNARTVRDLVLKAIFKKGAAKGLTGEENWIDHMRIDLSDLTMWEDKGKLDKPMEKLEQLIGLDNVKQEVKKLSSFVRVQQQRKQKNLPIVPIQLHAVFSGNPGTGKTTVAKLYSQILKECGLLKRGHFVIASRSDLVAGFVGQTAIKTKQKVREALGGVLFIDEAYSLFRGDKDFGKEAIDTLVDEMTKHNENLVVILAGYQTEMERFIASNPGLESRFKKYLNFTNYQEEELMAITRYHVEAYQYELEVDAEAFLTQKYKQYRIDGNARFVVNLIDEAIQFQALRMDREGVADLNRFTLLSKNDFDNAWSVIRGNDNEND
ncbi:AAA family ATPase [Aquibacillus salsiterrae]|uniref:AAA family ATPase n=1 Tax=Aquibacillus salsiterrae TaxID=2950439 RepID=A0A9X3WCS5_9BACI|nr:AAA family ATPase [Aquibacillus salsiterrae]MDC3416283.1 AAA family ATPase [Aquibacillus salsiterrae]